MARMRAGPVDDPAWRWMVAGVSPEAQAAARQAAEREGLALGEWLETAIMRAVESRLDAEKPAAPPAGDPRPGRRYF